MLKLLIISVICTIFLSGCSTGNSAVAQPTLKAADTEASSEIAEEDAKKEIAPGYEEFTLLAGKGLEEVNQLLGKKLSFQEEKNDSQIYTDGKHTEYYFHTKADALYWIAYKNMEAKDALKLAQDTCDKFYEEYEDMYFPDMVKDHIRDIKSIEDVENEKNPPAQYGEAWRIPYGDEMAEKLKDYRVTDEKKVTLSVDFLTAKFRDQGTYTVSISQTSPNLELVTKQ